jgi:hypothetical protein
MKDYQVRTISRQQNELNAWLEGGSGGGEPNVGTGGLYSGSGLGSGLGSGGTGFSWK